MMQNCDYFLLLLLIVISMAACGNSSSSSPADSDPVDTVETDEEDLVDDQDFSDGDETEENEFIDQPEDEGDVIDDGDTETDEIDEELEPDVLEEEDLSPDPCAELDCGENTFCEDGECFCMDGFSGDPYEGCTTQYCENSACGENAYCVMGRCKCRDGFSGNPDLRCLPIDGCEGVTCPANSQCIEGGTCACNEGFIGDPQEGCTPGPCYMVNCPWNAHCEGEGTCVCDEGHEWNDERTACLETFCWLDLYEPNDTREEAAELEENGSYTELSLAYTDSEDYYIIPIMPYQQTIAIELRFDEDYTDRVRVRVAKNEYSYQDIEIDDAGVFRYTVSDFFETGEMAVQIWLTEAEIQDCVEYALAVYQGDDLCWENECPGEYNRCYVTTTEPYHACKCSIGYVWKEQESDCVRNPCRQANCDESLDTDHAACVIDWEQPQGYRCDCLPPYYSTESGSGCHLDCEDDEFEQDDWTSTATPITVPFISEPRVATVLANNQLPPYEYEYDYDVFVFEPLAGQRIHAWVEPLHSTEDSDPESLLDLDVTYFSSPRGWWDYPDDSGLSAEDKEWIFTAEADSIYYITVWGKPCVQYQLYVESYTGADPCTSGPPPCPENEICRYTPGGILDWECDCPEGQYRDRHTGECFDPCPPGFCDYPHMHCERSTLTGEGHCSCDDNYTTDESVSSPPETWNCHSTCDPNPCGQNATCQDFNDHYDCYCGEGTVKILGTDPLECFAPCEGHPCDGENEDGCVIRSFEMDDPHNWACRCMDGYVWDYDAESCTTLFCEDDDYEDNDMTITATAVSLPFFEENLVFRNQGNPYYSEDDYRYSDLTYLEKDFYWFPLPPGKEVKLILHQDDDDPPLGMTIYDDAIMPYEETDEAFIKAESYQWHGKEIIRYWTSLLVNEKDYFLAVAPKNPIQDFCGSYGLEIYESPCPDILTACEDVEGEAFSSCLPNEDFTDSSCSCSWGKMWDEDTWSCVEDPERICNNFSPPPVMPSEHVDNGEFFTDVMTFDEEGEIEDDICLFIDAEGWGPWRLEISLISPSGTEVIVREGERMGVIGENISFRGLLSAYHVDDFIGESKSGDWTVKIIARVYDSTIELNGWCLRLSSCPGGIQIDM